MKGHTWKPDDSIQLSASAKNYNGANNTHFEVKPVKIRELAEFITNHNFSTIHWNEGSRKEAKFSKAVGITGDYDSGECSIQEVHEALMEKGVNHLIIPSKSHKAEHHKFHVVVPFNVPVYNATTYKKIATMIVEDMLPGSDPAVTDAARYIYGSPVGVDTKSFWQGSDYAIGDVDGLWDSTFMLRDKDENLHLAHEFLEKTPIFCPFHEDSNPSAFIEYSENSENWFIRCSTCDQTYWMLKEESHLERVCQDYYSYGTDVYDFGMANGEFFYEKIGRAKFHVLTSTENEPEKSEAFRHLVKRHHIRHLSRIDYISDISIEESYYDADLGKGVITAHHSAIPVETQDNQFIEEYLKDRFGQYLKFIKEWIAMFCYSNYQKLPTLIFNSDRGNGKSSFVEIIAEIFPTLSFQWGGSEDSFTYEVEKKLLIVDENHSDKISQYKTLKKYTGQKYATVKKKFKDPYQVKNNMSIIIMSNDAIPLFVNRGELPTDTKNNQFFVYELPALTGAIDPELQEKVLARLGHYIRTELKAVYVGLSTSGYRYSIDVPITDAEKELFAANATDLETEVDLIVERLVQQYQQDVFPSDQSYLDFINDGYLPVQWVKNYTSGTSHYNQVIKAMRRQRLIAGESEKKQVAGKRLFCFKITEILTSQLTDNRNSVSPVSSEVSGELFGDRHVSLI